jgi:hypothetical protein
MRSAWNDNRLKQLFRKYRRQYWPGRLRGYQIRAARLDEAYGQCNVVERVIEIDVESNASDRELRSTVLHEMAHEPPAGATADMVPHSSSSSSICSRRKRPSL